MGIYFRRIVSVMPAGWHGDHPRDLLNTRGSVASDMIGGTRPKPPASSRRLRNPATIVHQFLCHEERPDLLDRRSDRFRRTAMRIVGIKCFSTLSPIASWAALTPACRKANSARVVRGGAAREALRLQDD
jgi:hypothetical protein